MAKKDGGPAFAQWETVYAIGGGTSQKISHPGMSLRDWFAGKALVGLLACQDASTTGTGIFTNDAAAAKAAYALADAMLAERED